MTRPTLVVLAHGSRDPRSARTVREVVDAMKRLRGDLAIEAAFLEHNEPGLEQVVDRLAETAHLDIVVVPLFLTSAYHAHVDSPAAVAAVRLRHPSVDLRLADVVGTDPLLLRALDERVSDALRSTRAPRPDALVLASAGSSDTGANASIEALARLWGQRHGLPASAAFASTTTPSADDAVRRLRRAGCRRVAVGSLFIAPGMLPDRVRGRGLAAGAVAVSGPLGAHAQLCKVILERYRVSASTLGLLV